MKRVINLFIIAFFMFITGCGNKVHYESEIVAYSENLKVICNINHIKYIKDERGISSYIKGKIEIHNISNNKAVYNLEKMYLVINDSLKSMLYIDSIASILIQDKVLEPNQQIVEKVYWAFKGKFKPETINSLAILIDS